MITGHDNSQRQEGFSFQLAFTTNAQFLLDHLILGLGLVQRCFPPGMPIQCSAWHAQTPILLGWPIRLLDGSSVLFHFGLQPPISASDEDASLLQLGMPLPSHKIILPLASLLPQPTDHEDDTCERLTTVSVAQEQWQ